jgi:hypothetical protein
MSRNDVDRIILEKQDEAEDEWEQLRQTEEVLRRNDAEKAQEALPETGLPKCG